MKFYLLLKRILCEKFIANFGFFLRTKFIIGYPPLQKKHIVFNEILNDKFQIYKPIKLYYKKQSKRNHYENEKHFSLFKSITYGNFIL